MKGDLKKRKKEEDKKKNSRVQEKTTTAAAAAAVVPVSVDNKNRSWEQNRMSIHVRSTHLYGFFFISLKTFTALVFYPSNDDKTWG